MDCYNGDEDYLSLQDMIDRDIASGVCGDIYGHASDGPAAGVNGGGGGDSHQQRQHSSHGQMSAQHLPNMPTVDLDSSVSNLSWLHAVNIGSLRQEPDSRNTSLMVNPQTVTPAVGSASVMSSSPLRVIEVTLPSNVQITGSSVRYVTVPQAARTMYASSSESGANTAHRSTIGPQAYQQHPPGYFASAVTSQSSVASNPYPKPAYSYSCLIAMALKNSKTGSLPVSEIYNFMTSNFPYFKTAPDGWKNSVRHNLSLNKCFEKIENPNSDGASSRKGCLWSLNPAKARKMDEEIAKWNKKDPQAIKRSMAKPESFDVLERGHSAAGNHTDSTPVDRHHSATPRRIPTPVRASDATGDASQFVKPEHPEDVQHFNGIAAEHFRSCHESSAHMAQDDLALDPVLSDIAFQNSLWDELTGEVIDFPFNGSPGDFSHMNHLGSPYPAASPESMARYHGSYTCKTSGTASSSVPEGLGSRNHTPVARFVPATT